MKQEIKNRIAGFFKLIYTKLVKINDTPQRIAAGFGLGVFLGILPGTGPLAALFTAALLRVNLSAALFGSLLTNTWLSILTIPLSIKIGSAIMQLSWQKVYSDWGIFLKDFHWTGLFRLSSLEIILPVLLGYLALGLILGLTAFFIIFVIIKRRRYAH
jgi:uncharacterized protein (DUF2062 family)